MARVNQENHGGRLERCPETPNCVSSQADPADSEHYLPPVPYTGDAGRNVITVVVEVVASMERSKITVSEWDYLHAEFKSRVFRFTDDVEFLVDRTNQLVHFRSASRLGKADMGVNRKRMKEISEQLEQRL